MYSYGGFEIHGMEIIKLLDHSIKDLANTLHKA